MRLGEFIRAAASRRFDWNRYGCAELPAAWAGDDALRGLPPCSTEREVAAVIEAAGGLVALFDRQLAHTASRGAPTPGAIGVARMPEGMEMAGIVAGERWVFLTPYGIRAMAVPQSRILATWHLHG